MHRRICQVMGEKMCFVVGELETFLALHGLIRHLCEDEEDDVALIISSDLVHHVRLYDRLSLIRFWVARDDDAICTAKAKALDLGYKVHMAGAEHVTDLYERLGFSTRAMTRNVDIARDMERERTHFLAVAAEHHTYMIVEGDVDPASLPGGIPALRINFTRLTDTCTILDNAIQLHSSGGPLLMLAEILKLRCARFCHAASSPYPFQRVRYLLPAPKTPKTHISYSPHASPLVQSLF